MAMLLALTATTKAAAQTGENAETDKTAYVVVSTDGTTLTFYYDALKKILSQEVCLGVVKEKRLA